MGSRNHVRALHLLSLSLILILASSPILGSSYLKIPLEKGEAYEHLEKDISSLFAILDIMNRIHRFHCFIAYTGTFDLMPSFEQRLIEHFSVPLYTVGSQNGPLRHRYPLAETLVIVLFSGLSDPTLTVLNDTELYNGTRFFVFLYIPPRIDSRLLTREDIVEFFSWCWEIRLVRTLLFFRGEYEFETWTYFSLTNLRLIRIRTEGSFMSILRKQDYRFSVQAANDYPSIFWYNASEQADVIGGGNISLSGPVGILMVEFMRYINATMDILPIKKTQSSNYDIFKVTGDQRVDMVANLVANDSYLFSPIVADSQMCLVLPRRRQIPFNRYLDKVVVPRMPLCVILMFVCVFGVKYMAHRRRSVMDTLFSTLRFAMGVPLPGGQLERLPLADKIIEVVTFLCVGILIGVCSSILCAILTTGMYYPPITDVASMRASGLRILTEDPTVLQAFKDNYMPSALADLVDVADEAAVFQNFLDLNDSYVYVVRTPNWKGYRLYQERMENKKFDISGPELCSHVRRLRLPISPYSLLRFVFTEYFSRVFESGLEQKWLLMGFQKYREFRRIFKLPEDEVPDWKPLNLEFFSVFIKVYIACMLLSTVVFLMELLYHKYR